MPERFNLRRRQTNFIAPVTTISRSRRLCHSANRDPTIRAPRTLITAHAGPA